MSEWAKRLWLVAVFVALYFLLLGVANGRAHYVPGRHNAVHAIQQVWCGRANVECYQGNRAIRVAKCESSDLWWWKRNKPTQAVNGQYKGMFQMGDYERRKCGHGRDPWRQARAARCWWLLTGSDWGAWECQP